MLRLNLLGEDGEAIDFVVSIKAPNKVSLPLLTPQRSARYSVADIIEIALTPASETRSVLVAQVRIDETIAVVVGQTLARRATVAFVAQFADAITVDATGLRVADAGTIAVASAPSRARPDGWRLNRQVYLTEVLAGLDKESKRLPVNNLGPVSPQRYESYEY
uniref:Uncharacterized protein n=1 Tax=Romanomermis culicivorax TaxID=13658 RepID=A0A915JWA5_ROMCU